MTGLVQVPSFHGYTGATLQLNIDQAEHQRRQPLRKRHIAAPDVLDLLMSLPIGAVIPYADLTPSQQRAAQRAPVVALDFTAPPTGGSTVTRTADRPCRVDMATVRSATACETALGSATRFAPFCSRQVIIRHRPTMPATLIEFDFWGVGLLLEHDDGTTETLVQPGAWRPKRHTVAGWRFAEQAYATYLTHTLTTAKES